MLMGVLARVYPELTSFTADATLLEIKVLYGLGSLEEVRGLGRRRAEASGRRAAVHSGAPSDRSTAAGAERSPRG
jgi:hypothetical protein